MKIATDAFQASLPIPPPIPTPKIAPGYDGPSPKKPDDLLEEPLFPHPSKLFINPVNQKVISSTITPNSPAKDKGKEISLL